MDAESWYQVKEILELAIEQPPDRREQFIEERCSGDAGLRSKVDSLINSYERVGSFMEDEAIGNVAEMFASSKNSLEPGDLLGHYRIVRVLGEGGMGKVYLADDVDLHRQVAIKVLRDDLWWYKQARQRLLREARAAARLDHPNICSIYEIEDTEERSFIVMQYVEGNTLGHIMSHGGLGARESLHIALQIAGALEEAHSHHIIHRDIKPANIIVNEKRQAKVLDFGLAKSIEPHEAKPENDISSSGAVMGTVPYMSPEQLRGKTVDGRSDIFSFGALLYEMLSGRQVFGRDSNAETISAILNDEPDLSIIPAKLRTIIEKSLEKKVDDRYQTLSELAHDLRKIEIETADDTAPQQSDSKWFGAKSVISTAYHRYFSGGTGRRRSAHRSYYKWQDSDSDARTVRLTETVAPDQNTDHRPLAPGKKLLLPVTAAVCALVLIPTLYFWLRTPKSEPHSFDSLHSVQLVSWNDAGSNNYTGYSSSHDGKMIAYSSTKDGSNNGVYVKQIAAGDEFRVTRDQWNNYSPIWSPDDQWLAFVSIRNGAYGIYMSPFLGGAPTLVKSVARGSIYLRHWSNDGSAIFYEFDGNLLRLDLTTHGEQQLTNFEPSRLIERNFSLSPDESRIVYCDEQNGQIDLWVNQIAGGEPVRLTNDPEKEDHPVWHPDGKQIVYSVVRDGHHQISIAYLEGRRSEQVTRGEGEHQLIDVSADGKNMFYTSWEERSDVWRVSVDTGLESQVAAEKESEFWPDVSPDGKSVLYQTNSALESIPSITDSSIIISSLSGEVQPRVIKGYDPRWLPDGRHIGFLRWQGPEKRYSFWTADSVTGEEVQLIDQRVGPPGYATLPYNRLSVREFSWTPDSSQVAFISFRSGTSNVFKKVSGTTEAIGLTQNSDPSIVFSSPLFSPQGKQIAYVSVQRSAGEGTKTSSRVWIDEDGHAREVYSTDERIRLLGWTKSDGLILESSKDPVPTNLGEIMLIKLGGPGEPKTVAALKNAYSDSAALSIDGGTVTFTARQDKKDDIFTVPVDGGPQKKITSNNDPRIYIGSLVWSPDGKYIFFDKQQRVNTISMFENF